MMRDAVKTIGKELRAHAPFTMFGTLTGIVIMAVMVTADVPRSLSHGLFWTLHPVHVVLSALVTAGMYRRHSEGKLWATVVIGYAGPIGIATLSDCLIPYAGEFLLGLVHRGAHIGFIEKWWLVNPLAFVGIGIAYFRPRTEFPHAGHVLSSGPHSDSRETRMAKEAFKDEIKRLKEEREAVILAHNYQRPQVQDVADYLGDSLDLGWTAARTDAKVPGSNAGRRSIGSSLTVAGGQSETALVWPAGRGKNG